MRRNTLSEISGRVTHTFARVTLNKADDNHKWQELDADFMNSDSRTKIERLQNYGFTSMPHPRDDQKQGEWKEETGQPKKGPAAEAIAVFMGGQRNHPVIIGVDDRRHRPFGLKPGENAQYDDQKQMMILRRGGAYVLTLDDDKTKREASLRHVVKSDQGQPPGNPEYKHEGEQVTAEVKVTNGKIQFIVSGIVMGEVTSQGFVVGGSMDDARKRQIHRKDDIDSDGDFAETHAARGWAV